MNFKKTLLAAMPKMIGNPLSVATAMVSFALSVVKGQKAKKATKGKKKTTVRKSKILSKKQKLQMEVMERICQSVYGTYIRGATTIAARYIGHPAVTIPASEMVKTMMDEVAPPINKYCVIHTEQKQKIETNDIVQIVQIYKNAIEERKQYLKDKKRYLPTIDDYNMTMSNAAIQSVQYLNNKYHPEIRKASEELQQKKDNWIKESVEFARRVCIEYPEYATMTNKLLYNIPIDETKLNNEEKVELMLSGFVSGFIKDSALGLNGLADAAIYPIDTMEVLTSPDIASVAWDGMTRDIKADWKEGTIQGKSEAVGRTASVALPFLGVISKITKATGTAGKLTGTAAREAAERAAQEATERAAQEAAERAAQETTERTGKEVSQEVAERARKTDNSIPVKRGDSGSGANGSGVKIKDEVSETKMNEVETTEVVEKLPEISTQNLSKDIYIYQKYKYSLIKDDVLENSIEIIKGEKFGDQKLIAELTKDGSPINDWSKMESLYEYTTEYGTGRIHYYKNTKTGKVSYYDAKMKIPAPKDLRKNLTNTATDKGGFWIIDLDENLIPIGVRR